MSKKINIISNTTFQLLGKVVNTISSLLITIIIARALGAGFYGDFTKVFVTVTMFYIGIDFGMNAILVRRLKNSTSSEPIEFKNALAVRICFAFIFSVIISLAVTLVPTATNFGFSDEVKNAVYLFLITLFSQSITTTANAIFQSRMAYKYQAIATTVGSIVILILVGIFTVLGASLTTIILSYVVGSFTMALISFIFVRQYFSMNLRTISLIQMKALIKESSPIGFVLILNVLSTRLDIFLLSAMRTTEVVGYYGLAYRVFDVALVIPTFLMNASYPVLIEHLNIGMVKLKKTVKTLSITLFILSVIVTFGLVVISPFLVWIKEDYIFSENPLILLSLSLPFFFLSALMQWILVTVKKEHKLLIIYFLAVCVNLSLNLVLIPKYGMVAAAINTGATECMVLILSMRYVLQSLRQES